MKKDSRLSSCLHLLLHLADAERPLTSDELAGFLAGANPAALRRTLGGLRELGYLRSEKGHGGGWSLACDLEALTLRDVHEALGAPTFQAFGHRLEHPQCLVEQAVKQALDQAHQEAEALLLKRLGEVRLSDLAADFRRRLRRRGIQPEHTHGIL